MVTKKKTDKKIILFTVANPFYLKLIIILPSSTTHSNIRKNSNDRLYIGTDCALFNNIEWKISRKKLKQMKKIVKILIISMVCLVGSQCNTNSPVVGSRGNFGDRMSQAKEADKKQSELVNRLKESAQHKAEEAVVGEEAAVDFKATDLADNWQLPLCSEISKQLKIIFQGNIDDLTAEELSKLTEQLDKYLGELAIMPILEFAKLADLEKLALLINVSNLSCLADKLANKEKIEVENGYPQDCFELKIAFAEIEEISIKELQQIILPDLVLEIPVEMNSYLFKDKLYQPRSNVCASLDLF